MKWEPICVFFQRFGVVISLVRTRRVKSLQVYREPERWYFAVSWWRGRNNP